MKKNISNILLILLVLFKFSNLLVSDKVYSLNQLNTHTYEESNNKGNDNICSITLNNDFDTSVCDLDSNQQICLFNGEKILLPMASQDNLIGYWNFDEVRPIDNSGNRNHGAGVVKPGQALGGFGSSAYFSNGDHLIIPFSESFQSNDFSFTFWIFMIKDYFSSNEIRMCPILQKGEDDLIAKKYNRSPALFFDRKVKNLSLYLKTSSSKKEGQFFVSNSKLNEQRWFHIAIIKYDAILKLYVNGILDNQITLKGNTLPSTGNLYIGGVPWLKKNNCNLPLLMDELRFYNIGISEDKIKAESSPILGGLEPNFLQAGCFDCTLKEAKKSCLEGYRLCTSVELHAGGYQIARSLGWIDSSTHLWAHSALKTIADFENLKGLGLCCAELI